MRMLLLLTAACTVSSAPKCPGGSTYNSKFDSCYKFVNEPSANLDAEQDCAKDGGHLASIRSEKENAFIADLAQSSSNSGELYYWIGSPETNYTKWASGQSSLSGCPALTACGGLWATVDCAYNAPYVCRMEPFSCPDCPTCPALHSYCDSTWTYFEESDSCYKGFFDATWNEAETTCQAYNSHLTSIHSKAENDFIFEMVTIGMNVTFDFVDMTWIGLYRNPPGSKNFEFVDGTEFDPISYKNWGPEEPNNFGPNNSKENCVQLMSDKLLKPIGNQKIDVIKSWNDYDCAKQNRRFVCKKPAYHS